MTHPDPIGASRAEAPDRARALALRAGQWLVLLRFRVRPGAPTLAPDVTTYGDLLDPASSDERRRDACRRLLPHVRRHAEHERWQAEAERARTMRRDSYGREWRTTERGAALETVAALLEAVLAAFDATG